MRTRIARRAALLPLGLAGMVGAVGLSGLMGVVATPLPAGAASAPLMVVRPEISGTPGPASVTVTWTPGQDGGDPITGFTVTAADLTTPAHGHQTCVVGVVTGVTMQTPAYSGPDACTVHGLTAGDRYTSPLRRPQLAAPARPAHPAPS